MPSDLLINVKQISNYAARTASDGTETLLAQIGGLGGPYQSIRADTFVSTAVNRASLGVGTTVPADAASGNVLAAQYVLPLGSGLMWNAYLSEIDRTWHAGMAGGVSFNQGVGFDFGVAAPGAAGQSITAWTTLAALTTAGAMSLSRGTLTVARDPGAPMEVATSRWVSANTVASLNGRRGAVTLFHDDVTHALGVAPDDRVATQGSVQWAIAETLRTHPFVWAFNNRCGNVWLNLDDVMAVFMADGAQPTAPLAPVGDSSLRIANTAWVSRLLYGKYWTDLASVYAPLASPNFLGIPTAPLPPLTSNDATVATTQWVRDMIQSFAAGVVNFNGRTGFVTLELADIEDLFLAPGNTPLINTPPAGSIDGQIVNAQWTNAAIAQAVQDIVDNSVWTFNTRKGDVVLGLADIRDAEGQRQLFIGVNPPANQQASDLWMDSTDPTGGVLYVWYVDGTPGQWVALSGGAAGPMGAQGNAGPPGPALRPKGTVPTPGLLPTTGNQAGDLWFVSSTNESFAWDDQANQWVSLGVIGQAFPDAPSDGGFYARQNGQWVRLANDGVY